MQYISSILLLSSLVAASDRNVILAGSSGVPAMHATLLPDGTVMFLDKIENRSQLFLPDGRKAYSSIYDPDTQGLTPLEVQTNPFCCGGSFLADGRVLSVGGNGPLLHADTSIANGFDGIRYLGAGSDAWNEPGNKLASRRYLNGLDQLENNNNNPTYEILSPEGISLGEDINMDLLVNNQPYFMYPFIHLLKDGTLFVFVSRASQIFDPVQGKFVAEMPQLQGMYRTYPNTGGSVMLPLRSDNDWKPEIMVCGGGVQAAPYSACDATCGRIKPLDDARWVITDMPQPRGMVEGINMLDGSILWLNGAQVGAQGFGIADNPAYDLLNYHPGNDTWYTVATSDIPRLYHSVALMLKDGRILITGSNPNEMPVWPQEIRPEETNLMNKYPTELRIEIYTPRYLQGERPKQRPYDVKLSKRHLSPGDTFTITFSLQAKNRVKEVEVALYQGGFVTHSLHMGQALYFLQQTWKVGAESKSVTVETKVPAIKMAPGPYFVYVLANGIPSVGENVTVNIN